MALAARITALKGIALALSQDVEKMRIKPSRASQEGREFLNNKSLVLNNTAITVCNCGKKFENIQASSKMVAFPSFYANEGSLAMDPTY